MKVFGVTLLIALLGCGERKTEAPLPASPDARPAPDAAVDQDGRIRARALEVLACFRGAMVAAQKSDPALAAYVRNPFTDMFVHHALFDRPGRIDEDPKAACQALVKEYREAYVAHTPQARGVPVDATPAFVRAVGNRTGQHVLEHGEITRSVLREMAGGREPQVTRFVVEGVYRTDLNAWLSLSYHAHTEEHAAAGRAEAISSSQMVLVSLLTEMLSAFARSLDRGEFPAAAMQLGVACHVAQDLALHRGITRRQLAGLMRETDRDPRALDRGSIEEARRWTKNVVGLALEMIPEKSWRRFLRFVSPTDVRVDLLAQQIFGAGDGRSITFENLTDFWLMQQAERVSARPAGGSGELVRWDLAPMLEQVRDQLQRGGVALRARKR